MLCQKQIINQVNIFNKIKIAIIFIEYEYIDLRLSKKIVRLEKRRNDKIKNF